MAKNRDLSKFPNAITVLDNGNVGIGNTNPSTTLHLSTTNGIRLQYPGNTGFNQISTDGTNAYIFSGYDGERMRLTSAGFLGIGSTSPVAPLTIEAPAVGSAITATNAQTAYNYSRFRVKLYTDSNVGLSIGYAGANYTYIQTCYNEGSVSPLLLNLWGGGVGIGTSPGSNMLAIGGNASSNFRLAIENNTAGGSGVNLLANFTNQADADLAINISKVGATDKYAQITPSVSGLPIVIGVNNNPVKKPSNPAFTASYTSGGNVSGANVKLTGYTDARTNIGNCYNTSTCRFTASVAGMYLFKGQAWLPPSTTLAALSIRVNGSQKGVHRFSHTGTQSNYCTLTPTLIWYLSVGDYVELYTSTDGGEIHLSTGETYSNFSGVFLG